MRNYGSIARPIIKSLQSGLGLQTVDPSAHWPMSHSGYLTPSVICNAPENDTGFAGFKMADGCGVLRQRRRSSSESIPVSGAGLGKLSCARRADKQRSGEQRLLSLFSEGSIGQLD
jgi:hypothetical protein